MAASRSGYNLETLFLALADKTRLRILNLIGEDEICVGHLVDVLGESQPKISRHLAYLRNAGLVSVRRDGKWMHYHIEEPTDSTAAEVLRELLAGLSAQEEMRAERRRLEKIGGVTRKQVKPKKAISVPRPKKVTVVPRYVEPEPVEEYYEEEIEQPVLPPPRPQPREELETFLL